MTALSRFLSLPLGTRVVVRYRIPVTESGAPSMTDALGVLVAMNQDRCQVRTRTAVVTIELANIVAAKEIPLAPPRRLPHRPQL